ncbi:hypothetical protein [Haemophilus pittmaniae]|nr:hypothetical protein [Haemophilus pittmaniae]
MGLASFNIMYESLAKQKEQAEKQSENKDENQSKKARSKKDDAKE